MDVEAARRHYAEEVRFAAALRSEAIVRAFAAVPRERFLGPGPWLISSGRDGAYWATPDADPVHLYHNVLVAIDPARGLNNGQPSFWAQLYDGLGLEPGEAVCQIGAGTGYYTAILAEIVGPAGRVAAAEIDPTLADRARRSLADRPNVELATGDGLAPAPSSFDAVIVSAGAGRVPAVWLEALRPGGRLLVPLTNELGAGTVFQITRIEDDSYAAEAVGPVMIYPCEGTRDAASTRALARALQQGGQRFVRTLRRDAHERDRTCWLHGECCLSASER
jgi:protein-L-isoaspartate(D-aspartate) O-methyltransferase